MTNITELYPFLFEPAYKEVMWGGKLLRQNYSREMPQSKNPIGESWEIFDRPEGSSVVENGPLKGHTLHELVQHFRGELVGTRLNGDYFPLLIKIIDAGKRLSLQVHPSRTACAVLGKGEEKNEMWYVLDAEPGARIFAGLSPRATKMDFMDSLRNHDEETLLQCFDSIPGDAYFIHAGRVHAIGGGNLLLEIQQNSDTTFRISDWGRVGLDGKPRTLHLKEALACIDFTDRTVSRITGASDDADHNRKYVLINQCHYFQVHDMRLVEEIHESTFSSGSFHLVTAVNVPLSVGNDNFKTEVERGRTCLIPAGFGRYTITPEPDSDVTATVILTTL